MRSVRRSAKRTNALVQHGLTHLPRLACALRPVYCGAKPRVLEEDLAALTKMAAAHVEDEVLASLCAL